MHAGDAQRAGTWLCSQDFTDIQASSVCCLQVLLAAQEDVEALAARTKAALKHAQMQTPPTHSL